MATSRRWQASRGRTASVDAHRRRKAAEYGTVGCATCRYRDDSQSTVHFTDLFYAWRNPCDCGQSAVPHHEGHLVLRSVGPAATDEIATVQMLLSVVHKTRRPKPNFANENCISSSPLERTSYPPSRGPGNGACGRRCGQQANLANRRFDRAKGSARRTSISATPRK